MALFTFAHLCHIGLPSINNHYTGFTFTAPEKYRSLLTADVRWLEPGRTREYQVDLHRPGPKHCCRVIHEYGGQLTYDRLPPIYSTLFARHHTSFQKRCSVVNWGKSVMWWTSRFFRSSIFSLHHTSFPNSRHHTFLHVNVMWHHITTVAFSHICTYSHYLYA